MNNNGHNDLATRDWVISHNVIDGYSTYGIIVSGYICDLDIRSNTIVGDVVVDGQAIMLQTLNNRKPENTSIIDNTLTSKNHAIDVTSEIKNITIIGNDITVINDNPDAWWPSGAAGLGRVSGTGIFSNNKVKEPARGCYIGVWIADDGRNTEWTIEDNELNGNGSINNYGTMGILFTLDSAAVVMNRNIVTGWDTGIILDSDDTTVDLKYNCIFDNSYWGMRAYGNISVDAAYNYWGDASGPYHATNPGGQGNHVSDSVNFYPWYTDEDCTISSDHEAMDQDNVDTAIAKVPATIGSVVVSGGAGASAEDKKAAVKAYVENLEGMAALEVSVTVEAGTSSGYKVTITKGEATPGIKDNVQVTVFVVPPTDQEAADIVKGMVDDLPLAKNVGIDNYLTYLAAIEQAEAAFNALTEPQKELVDPYLVGKLSDLVTKTEGLVLEELDNRIISAMGDLNYTGTGIEGAQLEEGKATLFIDDPGKKVHEFVQSGVVFLFQSMFQDVVEMRLGDDPNWYGVEGTTAGAMEAGHKLYLHYWDCLMSMGRNLVVFSPNWPQLN